jgi:predicted ATPase
MSDPPPANGPAAAPPVPFLKRVRIRNYKSIASCDVELGALTVLVGRNGSGKSNFLDALAFVADALRVSPEYAVRSRGGFRELCNRRAVMGDASAAVGVEFDMVIPERFGLYAYNYGFSVGPSDSGRGLRVTEEHLDTFRGDDFPRYGFATRDGEPASATFRFQDMPPVLPDRLYLTNLLGGLAIRELYDRVCQFKIYHLNTDAMRSPQKPDEGGSLRRDGSNVASVLGRIAERSPGAKERLVGYLGSIVRGITDVRRVSVEGHEVVRFRQAVEGSPDPLEFNASGVSDGTLRVLGTLVAVAQFTDEGLPVSLVGIEEPETALHPAASAALMDALEEAAVTRQVVVTTHSPDLLDELDPETDRLLVVENRGGDTVIGSIDRASREIIKEQLYTPGELLRMDQLEPDHDDVQRPSQAPEPAGQAE